MLEIEVRMSLDLAHFYSNFISYLLPAYPSNIPVLGWSDF